MKTIISEIAKQCQWHKTVNNDFLNICEENIYKLQNMLPSGSGIDCGCKIDINTSGQTKVVIDFEFHHMDDGYYTDWTSHKLIITPTFDGFDMRITGKDKNGLKDYLYDTFDCILSEEIK